MKRHLSLLIVTMLVVGCKPKERTTEEKLADAFSQMSVVPPAATTSTVPVATRGALIFIYPDRIEVESTSDLLKELDAKIPVKHSPSPVAAIDATQGFKDNVKRKPGEPYVVPLANALQSIAQDTAWLVMPQPAPAKVLADVRGTLDETGIKSVYRVVRTADGKVAGEKL